MKDVPAELASCTAGGGMADAAAGMTTVPRQAMTIKTNMLRLALCMLLITGNPIPPVVVHDTSRRIHMSWSPQGLRGGIPRLAAHLLVTCVP
jgi:hypothetical protein